MATGTVRRDIESFDDSCGKRRRKKDLDAAA
jgi:hypothetical protein